MCQSPHPRGRFVNSSSNIYNVDSCSSNNSSSRSPTTMARVSLGGEDTARFALLAALILCYLLCGAAVFSALERPSELVAQERWLHRLENFTRHFGVPRADVDALLRDFELGATAGVRAAPLRPRWDFTGAFYFVGTVVSTIGFGMTTPTTVSGKIFLIFYGLFGCAAGILFFNLFLERLITLLACVMRSCHRRQINRLVIQPGRKASDQSDTIECLAGWKPSVYHVMMILGIAAVVIACSASAMFAAVEGWSYVDSLYFCFVAFSTIGFGDLVTGQRDLYDHQTWYRVGNIVFILAGVCCIYSLFNVLSIVIKQTLTWMLHKADCRRLCRRRPRLRACNQRRNAVMPGVPRGRRNNNAGGAGGAGGVETVAAPGPRRYDGGGAGNDSDTDGRRLSGELISMKDFLASNKVSLALMQKQLSEAANGHHHRVAHRCSPVHSHSLGRENGFAAGVGALAIMNNRLAETSEDR
ncbi:potassium channel, subfamily K, member 13-like [Lampetra planeri]